MEKIQEILSKPDARIVNEIHIQRIVQLEKDNVIKAAQIEGLAQYILQLEKELEELKKEKEAQKEKTENDK
jgi:hypothetical protein